MDKAERVALADAALDAMKNGTPLTFTAVESNANDKQGDTPTPSASGQPATETVTPTPTEAGKPDAVAGSDVSTTTQEEIVFPAWVQKGSQEALRSLSKEARAVVLADMDAKRVSLERDATKKWEEVAEERKDAAKWRTIANDPEKGKKVLEVLEAPGAAPAVDPRMAELAEILGSERAASLIIELADTRAVEKAKAVVHETVEAPNEHIVHTNRAAMEAARQLGLTEEEFQAARRAVGEKHGYTPENEQAPYAVLNPQNVAGEIALAVLDIRAKQPAKTPAASPPKPPVAKPASVQSNGMATDTEQRPPWVRENRAPAFGERAAWTMRKHALTEADVVRHVSNM